MSHFEGLFELLQLILREDCAMAALLALRGATAAARKHFAVAAAAAAATAAAAAVDADAQLLLVSALGGGAMASAFVRRLDSGGVEEIER